MGYANSGPGTVAAVAGPTPFYATDATEGLLRRPVIPEYRVHKRGRRNASYLTNYQLKPPMNDVPARQWVHMVPFAVGDFCVHAGDKISREPELHALEPKNLRFPGWARRNAR